MARLIYSAITSLDGYIADADGRFDWLAPDPEVHRFVNELARPVGTHLYGRRMYEVMVVWESVDIAGLPAEQQDWARIWRAADKVVYSRTLGDVSSQRTRLERDFDADAVRRLKDQADADLSIGGGPGLAAEAFRAGLIDQVDLLLSPVALGGGTPALPPGQRIALALVDERRFANGVVHLRYRPSPA